MSTHYDFAVQVNGVAHRFIGAGTKGAIFAKDGTKRSVTIVEPPKAMRAPKVVDEDGKQVLLSRIAKPCSCRGGVWKMRPSELTAQL